MTLIDQILYHRIDYITVQHKILINVVIYIFTLYLMNLIRKGIFKASKIRARELMKKLFPDEKILYMVQICGKPARVFEIFSAFFLASAMHFVFFKNIDPNLLFAKDSSHCLQIISSLALYLYGAFYSIYAVCLTDKKIRLFTFATTEKLAKSAMTLPIEDLLQDEEYIQGMKRLLFKKDFEAMRKLAQEYTVKKEENNE